MFAQPTPRAAAKAAPQGEATPHFAPLWPSPGASPRKKPAATVEAARIAAASTNKPLSGYTIGIEAGIGGQAPIKNKTNLGKVDVWTRQLEAKANLRVAEILEAYLTHAGAKVVPLYKKRQPGKPVVHTGDPSQLIDFVLNVNHSYSVIPQEDVTAAYYYPGDDPALEAVARRINEALSFALGIPGVGALPSPRPVAEQANAPGVLLILSLMSNPDEFIHVLETPYNLRESEAIMRGAINFAREQAGLLGVKQAGGQLGQPPSWRLPAMAVALAGPTPAPSAGLATPAATAMSSLRAPATLAGASLPSPRLAMPTPAPKPTEQLVALATPPRESTPAPGLKASPGPVAGSPEESLPPPRPQSEAGAIRLNLNEKMPEIEPIRATAATGEQPSASEVWKGPYTELDRSTSKQDIERIMREQRKSAQEFALATPEPSSSAAAPGGLAPTTAAESPSVWAPLVKQATSPPTPRVATPAPPTPTPKSETPIAPRATPRAETAASPAPMPVETPAGPPSPPPAATPKAEPTPEEPKTPPMEEPIETGKPSPGEPAKAMGEQSEGLFPFEPMFLNPVKGPVDQTWLFGEQYETNPLKRGVSFRVPAGTPVRAVAPGAVVDVNYGDQPVPFLPFARSVLIEHQESLRGEKVYTMYGQMAEVNAALGQQVKAGDAIGKTGPGYDINKNVRDTELEFEVRIGGKGSEYARNPELFIDPQAPGTGMIVGRIVSENFRSLPGRRIDGVGGHKPEETHPYYSYTLSYAPGVSPSFWEENFVISAALPGTYELTFPGGAGGQGPQKTVTVQAGKIAYVTVIDSSSAE